MVGGWVVEAVYRWVGEWVVVGGCAIRRTGVRVGVLRWVGLAGNVGQVSLTNMWRVTADWLM